MKNIKLLLASSLCVSLLTLGTLIYSIGKNNLENKLVFSEPEKITSIVSFNKSNHTCVPYAGGYENHTRALTNTGMGVTCYSFSSVDLTNSSGIALLDGENSPISFYKDNNTTMYFQELTSVAMTFTNDSNGEFDAKLFSDDHHYSFQRLTVTNGELITPIEVEGIRTYVFNNSSALLEVTSITFNYSCLQNYNDPLDAPKETINVYSSNDFHGYVKETNNNIGLEKYGTFFKERGKEDNTLLLDQGDSWQGTAYSNMNYGNLVNDVMSYAEFDARTVGNHDFDWGVDALKANTSRVFTYQGKDYQVPTLAANIYDYNFNTKKFGNNQQSDIGEKTVTRTLENGLKVGIIGVIGEAQITTINSLFTHDIGFKPHIPIIKEEANRLKNEEHCDIVILSIHGGQEDVTNQGLENYVDLVLCGHTHQRETIVENGLLYFQSGCYGERFGYIQLTHNTFTNETYPTYYGFLDKNDIESGITEIDPVIHNLVQNEIERVDEVGKEVLATGVSGTFYTNNQGPNIVAKAIYDYAVEVDGINDIQFTYVNNTRSAMYSGTWTYANIYQMIPFDNIVYVTEITGREIYDEIRQYNWICRNPNFNGVINMDQKYKIAVIDFLLFHTNENRYYDYFPESGGLYSTTLSDNYRNILKWWLKDYKHYDQNANYFSSSDFDSSLSQHNKNFTYNECTVTFHWNYEGCPNTPFDTVMASYKQTFSSVCPSNPTRDGYTFDGWYLNSECTIGAPTTVKGNLDVYAKWISGSTYITQELHWDTFVNNEGNKTSSTVQATNNLDESINVTLNHSVVTRYYYNTTPYDEFTMTEGKYISLSLSGYKVVSVEAKIYNTYDNLDFYKDTSDSNPSNKLDDSNYVNGSKYKIYTVNVNSPNLYIKCTYTSTQVYYIKFFIQQI